MSDYKNLKWEGTLDGIILAETQHSDESRVELVAPKGTIEYSRLQISLSNGGNYMPEFIGSVPREYIGKRVVFTESLETKQGIKTHTQVITSEGLDPLVASTSWKA